MTVWSLPSTPLVLLLLHTQARYLKDSLDSMLGSPAYLDSSNLADLRKLFEEGVHVSEVLVLLLSDGLLTRPWCLLEIKEAMAQKKPIVLLELRGKGFSFEKEYAMLADLEHELPPRNPYAVPDLLTHLGDVTLSELGQIVRDALELGRAGTVPALNLNGTSNQLEAQLVDLCEALASATTRTLEWNDLRRKVEKQALKKQELKRAGTTQLLQLAPLGDVALKLTGRSHSSEHSQDEPQDVCIVYHPNAAAHAERLKLGMYETLGRECCMTAPPDADASDEDTWAHEAEACLRLVAKSELLLLVQTADVLAQPWTLLAVFWAYRAHVPIVCVNVNGHGCAHACTCTRARGGGHIAIGTTDMMRMRRLLSLSRVRAA